MIVLVSDTSVLIDLERGGLLEAAFACGDHQMEATGAIALVLLAEGLQKIVAHPRCRLPKHDVNERLARWLVMKRQ